MRNFIIRFFGGMTKDDFEEKRSGYEKWAVENLTGKNGEVTPNCMIYIPFDNDDICVIRSKIEICNAKIKGLKVAPWCKDIITIGLRI